MSPGSLMVMARCAPAAVAVLILASASACSVGVTTVPIVAPAAAPSEEPPVSEPAPEPLHVQASAQQAGTITGTVVAGEDGRPVAEALVTIDGASPSAVTNAVGRFEPRRGVLLERGHLAGGVGGSGRSPAGAAGRLVLVPLSGGGEPDTESTSGEFRPPPPNQPPPWAEVEQVQHYYVDVEALIRGGESGWARGGEFCMNEVRSIQNLPNQTGALDPRVLDDIVRRVVEVAAPERIILFGSAARGEMGPHSDVDLLVVVETDDTHRLTGDIYGNLFGVGAPVDVIVVSPEHVERYRDTHALVIKPALREGRVIYGADPADPDLDWEDVKDELLDQDQE